MHKREVDIMKLSTMAAEPACAPSIYPVRSVHSGEERGGGESPEPAVSGKLPGDENGAKIIKRYITRPVFHFTDKRSRREFSRSRIAPVNSLVPEEAPGSSMW